MAHRRNRSRGLSLMDSSFGDSADSVGNTPEGSVARAAGSARAETANRDAEIDEMRVLLENYRRENAALKAAHAPRVQVPVPPASPPRRQEGNFQDQLKILEHMRRIGTLRFRGTTDPVEAEAWMDELKRNLSLTRCPDEYKKDTAVFFLERDAVHWWKRVERKYGSTAIRWEDFQREFKGKYVPPQARERLTVRFQQLEQGDLTVRQYEAEFTQLGRFANEGEQEEEAMIRKFMRGLEPCIQGRV